ncbi:MAG: nitrous oxide reductase accessory protein NosL [Pseudomonadota bacterium]
MRRRTFVGICLWLPWVARAAGPEPLLRGPGLRDLCPVCGMVVAKYPNWVASVAWKGGQVHFFDGAKDLFKYLFDLPRYAPGRRREEITGITVTEYYDLRRIDARQAWFVIGSDVHGPMGHELIPFASQADADEFLRDHGGRRILRFADVKADLPVRLDQGQF